MTTYSPPNYTHVSIKYDQLAHITDMHITPHRDKNYVSVRTEPNPDGGAKVRSKPEEEEAVRDLSFDALQTQEKLDKILALLSGLLDPVKPCAICGRVADFVTEMPFGSAFEGDMICGDCCATLLDPVIQRAKEAQG